MGAVLAKITVTTPGTGGDTGITSITTTILASCQVDTVLAVYSSASIAHDFVTGAYSVIVTFAACVVAGDTVSETTCVARFGEVIFEIILAVSASAGLFLGCRH